MTVTVVRYRTRPERADENQQLVEQVFAGLDESRPGGLRYMTIRLDDGVSFVHIASVRTVDGAHPLTSTPAFVEFQRELGARVEEGPIVTEGAVVGAYELDVEPATVAGRP